MRNIQEHNAANEEKWSRRAITFDQRRYDIFRYLQWELIQYAGITAPCNFLDLGCGTGWAVRHAAKRLHGNGRFVGVDISRGMIERAKSHADGIPKVEFYEGSAEHLPVGPGAFDTVICSNSFHHYLLPQEALKEAYRILRPSGRIFILDVTADDPFVRWINKRASVREKEHVKFYGTDEYQRMFMEAGITPVRSGTLKILYPLKVHVGEKKSV